MWLLGKVHYYNRDYQTFVDREQELSFLDKKHVGFIFEDVCKGALPVLGTPTFTKIGRWWHRDEEIDIVALDEKEKQILFAECKWQSKVDAEKVLQALKEKAELVE